MKFDEKEIESFRQRKVEWHLPQVQIKQSSLQNELEFCGYGILKMNENGGIFLDFICTKSNALISFRTILPEDSLDERQELTLSATTLTGRSITSKGFTIYFEFGLDKNGEPRAFRIPLFEFTVLENRYLKKVPYETEKSLCLVFNEECDIPTNISNTTNSSLGARTFSWNQTKIDYCEFEINIIRHTDYTEVWANGKDLSLEELREALVFYLSFTTGVFVQPYYEYFRENRESFSKFKSIDGKLIGRSIPAPLSARSYDENKNSLDHFHYELFNNICNEIRENKKRFQSVLAQWNRIWYSFLSPERNVAMLTLSVSIEGILNDIFLPRISEIKYNEKFEQEKQEIITILDTEDRISRDHKKSLKQFVEKWGGINPKKGLGYLADVGIIEKRHIKTWVDLRNSSAHPTLSKNSESKIKKDYERITVCLGLFYRLSLNVFKYRGAQYVYEAPKESKIKIYDYVKIL